MARKGDTSEADRRAYVKVAQTEGRAAAAKHAGVSTHTISAWAKALGETLGGGKGKKASPARKKRKRGKVNGKANGAANGRRFAEPPAPSQIDAVLADIERAGEGLRALRAAFRGVFG